MVIKDFFFCYVTALIMLLGKQMPMRYCYDSVCSLDFFALTGFLDVQHPLLWCAYFVYRSCQREIAFVVTTGCDAATTHNYSQMKLIYKHHAIALLIFISGSLNLQCSQHIHYVQHDSSVSSNVPRMLSIPLLRTVRKREC